MDLEHIPPVQLIPSARTQSDSCCTWMLGCPAPAGLIEGCQGAYGGPEDAPAEHGHGVCTNQLPQEAPLAATQQSHDVWPHVVCVLLTEVLRVGVRGNIPPKSQYLLTYRHKVCSGRVNQRFRINPINCFSTELAFNSQTNTYPVSSELLKPLRNFIWTFFTTK